MNRHRAATIVSVLCAAAFLAGGLFVHLVPVKRLVLGFREVAIPVPYQDRLDFLRKFPKQAEIVMVGNSLTRRADWSALLPGVSIANAGISGDGFPLILNRVEAVKATGARHAFIMAGINNLAGSDIAETVFPDYRKLIDALAEDMSVTVQSTLRTAGRYSYLNPEVAQLNRMLSDYCDGDPCTFLDLNAAVAPEGILLPEASQDGLHLTARGYALWRDALQPDLRGSTGASR